MGRQKVARTRRQVSVCGVGTCMYAMHSANAKYIWYMKPMIYKNVRVYICVCICLCAYVSVCHVSVGTLRGQKEGVRSLGAGVTES